MNRKLLSLVLAAAMLLALLPCTTLSAVAAGSSDTHTLNTYLLRMCTDWNPHTWTNSTSSEWLDYIRTPLVDVTVKNSSTGEYQWIFLAATNIQDVTASHQDDLVKYGSDETDASYGYVYEISLNPELCWEDGTPINADTYIYSMKALLDPARKNYRANTYYAGDARIAGAEDYYYSGSSTWIDAASTIRMSDLLTAEDGSYTTADGDTVMFSIAGPLAWLGGNSLADYVAAYGDSMFDTASFEALLALADENGNVPVNAETIDLLTKVITFSPDWNETAENVAEYLVYGKSYPVCEYDGTVGCYKVDDYTIRYVCQSAIDYPLFLSSMISNWIVYEDLYEAGNYCTGASTTMSYGPYRMDSYSSNQTVFTRNENYYEYDVDAGGNITSTTSFQVDGVYVPQWQTDKIVISQITYAVDMQNRFLRGGLDIWTPTAEELLSYSASSRLYRAETTYTYRLFFNTDVSALQTMDTYYGNTNSVVMSNINFRKAFSLAIDRSELVTATSGNKEAITLLNNLYYYDVYNNPDSVYRSTAQAKAAICDLYGVSYTDSTLDQAYDSITGYDLAQARELMAAACDDLVAAGLYAEGDPIVIQVVWASNALSDSAIQQNALITDYLNAAARDSGFGTITLEAVGYANPFSDVPDGHYAIGMGAWGGAAFYPFTLMQVYCEPSYSIHEGACYDPTTEELTLVINGTSHTMTWQEWSHSMTSGIFSGSDMEIKLEVLSKLEAAFLSQYYCIPLSTKTECTMLSHKVDYYTKDYSNMYGFGGLRLMRYNYTDAEWDAYVASGNLNYPTNGEVHTHNYHAVVTAPTCTMQGYTTHTCSCGDSYVDSYTDPIGHNFVSGLCLNCGQVRILEGENSHWETGSEEAPAIRIEAQPEDLLSVYLNGELVDPSNYTVTHGSTIITFKPEYLATLPEGEHTVTVEFTVGTAVATLTVVEPEEIPWNVYLDEPGSYTAIDGQSFYWTAPENGNYTFSIDSKSNWSYFGNIDGWGVVYGEYGEDEFSYGPSFEMYMEAGATAMITLYCQEYDPNGANTVDFTFTFEPDGTGTGGYVMESTHQISGDGSEEDPYVYATIEDFVADWTNRKVPESGRIFITAPLGGKTLTIKGNYTAPDMAEYAPWLDWLIQIRYMDSDGEIYNDYNSVFAMYEEPPVDTFTFNGAAFEELTQMPSYMNGYTLLDEPWQEGSMITIAMFGPGSSPYFIALDMIVEGVAVPDDGEDEEKTYALGDVNGDGEVDIFDANLAVGYYNGTVSLDADALAAADVNGDGEIDIFDANLIVSYYNGTIAFFPAEE